MLLLQQQICVHYYYYYYGTYLAALLINIRPRCEEDVHNVNNIPVPGCSVAEPEPPGAAFFAWSRSQPK